MKSFLVLTCASLLLLADKSNDKAGEAINESSLSCATPVDFLSIKDAQGKYINVLPGWGKHSYKISTASDSAQLYFDQGLNLYYSYHLKQAVASFKEAGRFDSTCAMPLWGQALALGPFYNDPVYKMNPSVPGVVYQMLSRRAQASQKEQALIDAMQRRYSNDLTNADRPQLDQRYTDAMKQLVGKYHDDPDIKSLYVDAVMLQHKWDFWNNDGTPKPWTKELMNECERVLEINPMHPAASHYYIHVTEASRHPELALKSADALKDAMPGTAHMVHMASHMYQRNGLFKKGVDVNEAANTASNIADSLHRATGNGQNTTIHYFAVQAYCALSAGMYESATPVYERARKRVVELNAPLDHLLYGQFVYSIPTLAAVRTGKWEVIKQEPDVSSNWIYATIIQQFAKGLAAVRQHDLDAADKHHQRLTALLDDSSLFVTRKPFNKPIQTARIAAGLLHAELLVARKQVNQAITAYEKAIKEEDALIYSEPQEWMLPVRQYYGSFLLKEKKTKQAEIVFRQDLQLHHGNGWSLLGLYLSLNAQNKKAEAVKLKQQYEAAFTSADVKPSSAVF